MVWVGIVVAILVVLVIWIIVKAIQEPVSYVQKIRKITDDDRRRKRKNTPTASSRACIESRFATDVANPFRSGVSSLSQMVETLDRVGRNPSKRQVDAVLPLLQYQAKAAYRGMKEAEKEVSQINKELNEVIEVTLKELGKIRKKLSSKNGDLSSLKSKRGSLRKEERQIDKELSDAKRSVDSAKRSVSDAKRQLEKKKEEQAIVAGVGVGVSVIPIVGWIVGPALVVVSFTALEDNVKEARRSIGYAEDSVRNARSRRSSKKSALSNIEDDIAKHNKDYSTLKKKLSKLEGVLDGHRQQLQRHTRLSEDVKQCFTFISVSFGRTTVVKDTAKCLYNIESLVEPLRSLAEHFSAPELLSQPLLRKAVDFGKVQRNLKMICTTASLKLIDDDDVSQYT